MPIGEVAALASALLWSCNSVLLRWLSPRVEHDVVVQVDRSQRAQRQEIERVALGRNDARLEPPMTANPAKLDLRRPLA